MDSNTIVSPVDLRKKPLPGVMVYGDDTSQNLTKLLFSLIPGQQVRFLTPTNMDELIAESYHSAIVFVIVNDATDDNMKLAKTLSEMPGVVADIIALTPEPEIRRRLHMMTHDFDGIFNVEILDMPEFRDIFLHKLKKGIMRLNSQIQEDEYKTFQGFMSVSPDAFIIFDKNKRILFVSDHYLKVYKKSGQYLIRGTPVQQMFEAAAAETGITPADPRYHEAQKFWASLKGQLEYHLDNGKVLRVTAVPMPNGEGTIVTTTDITHYKEQERKLAEKQKELEKALNNEMEASKLQKQFISMVSHEFRTPLSIVDGNAQILQRRMKDLSSEDRQSRLKTIRSAVSRLVSMMEAVLSSNMLKTGKLDIYPEPFNVKGLIRELCQEQVDLSSRFKIDCDIETLPEQVNLDRKVLTLILTNLLSNAVKFSQETPEIGVAAFIDDQGKFHLGVKDRGVGIPDNELAYIYDTFFRATTSSGIPGSGVGLSLVKDLVTLHGGIIDVKSKLGEGTFFEVVIPCNLVASNRTPVGQIA